MDENHFYLSAFLQTLIEHGEVDTELLAKEQQDLKKYLHIEEQDKSMLGKT